MARLRRVDCGGPGISRRGRGKGFEYLDEGTRIEDPEMIDRIRALAIPPAWRDVWICPLPMGHIQATGTDAAGRKQYRYHDRWRERRDREKFESMLDFAAALPRMRRRVKRDLAGDELARERVLACALRLLDLGFFRIGSEDYAESNETYGLATIRKDHVTLEGGFVIFAYDAKGGKPHVRPIADPDVMAVVRPLMRRRGGGEKLLAYKQGRRWVDVKSGDVNEYLKAAAGGSFSAKDFRTWNATVLAAVALGVSGNSARTKTARKRVIKRAVEETAYYLGNTPAVCRASYIDPRVFDRFNGGLTIGGALPDLAGAGPDSPMMQRSVEEAVLDLIGKDMGSDALERVA